MSAPLQPFAPGTVARCPECDGVIHGFDQENDVQPVYRVEPMWEGGPPVEATWEMPVTHRIDSTAVTVHPCGHVFRDGFTLTVHRA